jgi:hypothetical protein
LLTHPPVVAKADTIGSDSSESNLRCINGDVVDNFVDLGDV